MTDQRIRSDVQVAATLLVALQPRLGPTITNITNHLDELDGWPTRGDGTGGGNGPHITVKDEHGNPDRVPVTSVEAAALRRIGPSSTGPIDELGDLTAALVNVLKLIHRQCDRWAPTLTASDLQRIRCIGTGDADGATCEQIADPTRTDGRCLDCGPKIDKRRRMDADRRRAKRHAS